ncbi:3915_t:CDS:1 [Diversispora eburnea]|uniref:3915_t:CDS:1 n=1 Tax=Diversispora eburnea TaxID=1213867 RepID=A0A9N9AXF3_9GLOM|nr:3915_t:CDS:1 [Diversispora eburnea]
MPFKKNKQSFRQKFGGTYPSFSSLLRFPNEILSIIFEEIDDIPTLINLSSLCKRFKLIANNCLKKLFRNKNVRLQFYFEQEHKLNFDMDFFFEQMDEKTGNFIFQPKQMKQLKFYSDQFIRNPTLWQMIFNISDNEDDENNNKFPKLNNPNYPFNYNLLQKSCKLSIKTPNSTCRKIKEVYRVGDGTTHLKVPYKFSYLTENPPASSSPEKIRERWIVPLSFECPTSFFYPNSTKLHRIVNSIMTNTKNRSPIKRQKTIIEEHNITSPLNVEMGAPIIIQRPEIKEKKSFKFKWSRGVRS